MAEVLHTNFNIFQNGLLEVILSGVKYILELKFLR